MRPLPMKTMSDDMNMTRLECMECPRTADCTVDECWCMVEAPRCKECGGTMFPHGLFSSPKQDEPIRNNVEDQERQLH